MTVATQDLEVWKGNDWSQTFAFVDGTGAALDLTGSSLVFRATAPGMTTLRKSSPSSGITIPTPANGQAVVTMSIAETRLLPLGMVALYEIEFRSAGTQTTLVAGRINALGGVNDDA